MQLLRPYVWQLGLLSAASALVGMFLRSTLAHWMHPHWVAILIATALINLLCFVAAVLVVKQFKGDAQATTFGLLAALSAHLILYLFFVLGYYLLAGKPAFTFALNLMVFYILFLVFELVSLLNILRPLSNEPKKPF